MSTEKDMSTPSTAKQSIKKKLINVLPVNKLMDYLLYGYIHKCFITDFPSPLIDIIHMYLSDSIFMRFDICKDQFMCDIKNNGLLIHRGYHIDKQYQESEYIMYACSMGFSEGIHKWKIKLINKIGNEDCIGIMPNIHYCKQEYVTIDTIVGSVYLEGGESIKRGHDNQSSVDQLCALGFERYWVSQALELTNYNKDYALEWLLSDEFKLARQPFNNQRAKFTEATSCAQINMDDEQENNDDDMEELKNQANLNSDWLCQLCGVEVKDNLSECHMCNAVRPGETDWICSICIFVNAETDTHCQMCLTEQPNNQSLSANPQLKQEQTWSCPSCQYHNTKINYCRMCGYEKGNQITAQNNDQQQNDNNDGWKVNDIITVILNCEKWTVTFYVNGKMFGKNVRISEDTYHAVIVSHRNMCKFSLIYTTN